MPQTFYELLDLVVLTNLSILGEALRRGALIKYDVFFFKRSQEAFYNKSKSPERFNLSSR